MNTHRIYKRQTEELFISWELPFSVALRSIIAKKARRLHCQGLVKTWLVYRQGLMQRELMHRLGLKQRGLVHRQGLMQRGFTHRQELMQTHSQGLMRAQHERKQQENAHRVCLWESS